MPTNAAVRPSGDIDLATVERVAADWRVAVEARPDRLVIDLTDVGFLGTAGASLIATVARQQHEHGGEVLIMGARPVMLRALQATGVLQQVRLIGGRAGGFATPRPGGR
jgi:anti-sigma B factor antagonist